MQKGIFMVRMISDNLVSLIEQNADVIVDRWIAHLLSDPTTTAFSDQDLKKFKSKANEMIGELGRWVGYETTKEEVGRRYAAEGKGLFGMRIPLCEGIRALVLLKRTIWLYVVYESTFDSAIELHQMRELNDRVLLFFDRAQYYFIRGYMEAMNERMKDLWDFTDADTKDVFFDNSFYGKIAP